MEAYNKKVAMIESYEPGLMSEAQRFFLLSQTDALWKDHLQAIKQKGHPQPLEHYESLKRVTRPLWSLPFH